MEIQFNYSASLSKGKGESDSKKLPISIIPNVPTKDRVNDTIHLKAFQDEDCKNTFLQEGIIDYDHQSVRGKTSIEKAQAVIGQPEDLYIDEEKNIPICDAYLFRSNPFVKNSIEPALETMAKVFGASVGGKILKSAVKDPVNKSAGKNIFKIKLKHIAICPLQNAIHGGTMVSLRKSIADDGEEYENVIEFNNADEMFKSFDEYEKLEKALTAGSSTSIVGLSGGQVLQKQSLEGNVAKLVLPFFLESIVNKSVDNNQEAYKGYLKRKGLNDKISSELIKMVATNVDRIAEKFL